MQINLKTNIENAVKKISPIYTRELLSKVEAKLNLDEKNTAFNKWYLELEKRSGYSTELFSEPNTSSDHHVDLVRWTDKNKNEATAIRLINCPNFKISHKMIQDLIAIQNNNNTINFSKIMIVCSGEATQKARELAAQSGVIIIDGIDIWKKCENFITDPLFLIALYIVL